MDGHEFFKPVSIYAIMAWTFSKSVLFWVMFQVIPGECSPWGLLWILVILFPCYLSIQSFLMFFPFIYFTPKLFCFRCIQLLVCPCVFSIKLFISMFICLLIFNCYFITTHLSNKNKALSKPQPKKSINEIITNDQNCKMQQEIHLSIHNSKVNILPITFFFVLCYDCIHEFVKRWLFIDQLVELLVLLTRFLQSKMKGFG